MEQPDKKRSVGKPRSKWEGNIKTVLEADFLVLQEGLRPMELLTQLVIM